MNLEVLQTNEPTMTLKEITDLLEVRHNDAMDVVDKMAKNPDFQDTKKSFFEIINKLGHTVKYETYLLNKRQSIAVAARLNTSLLMRIIDRWQELEAQQAKPMTRQDHLRLTADILDEQERQAVEIEGIKTDVITVKDNIQDVKDQVDYLKAAHNELYYDDGELKEMTIRVFCNLNNIPYDSETTTLKDWGAALSRYLRARGVHPRRVPHPVYKHVNLYTVEDLENFFNQLGLV